MSPSRRTIIVLASLLAAMTVTAAVLMVAQPGPVAPISGISLSSLNTSDRQQTTLFDTAETLAWQGIVVHYSGTTGGDWKAINTIHEQLGLGGLGYHFVLGNGRGADDGEVHAGFRWINQRPGAYAAGPDAAWFNGNAIGICMIGDFDRDAPTQAQMDTLRTLVRQLQQKFGIPAERVYSVSGNGKGLLFPEAEFRSRLIR